MDPMRFRFFLSFAKSSYNTGVGFFVGPDRDMQLQRHFVRRLFFFEMHFGHFLLGNLSNYHLAYLMRLSMAGLQTFYSSSSLEASVLKPTSV